MDSVFFKEYQEQKKHIYICYKQLVEGYTVTALCTIDRLDIIFSENNGISGKALLRFGNDSTISMFIILHFPIVYFNMA